MESLLQKGSLGFMAIYGNRGAAACYKTACLCGAEVFIGHWRVEAEETCSGVVGKKAACKHTVSECMFVARSGIGVDVSVFLRSQSHSDHGQC